MKESGNKKRILAVDPAGWACFEYGGIYCPAISYVCDPHIDLADSLAKVLGTGEPSFVHFDYEGSDEYLAVTDCGLTLIGKNKDVNVPMSASELIEFSERLASELEEDADDWIASWVGLDDVEYADEARIDLMDTIEVLRTEARQARSYI